MDIKQPMAVSYTFWDWLREHWVLACCIFLALLIAAGTVWYLKTRPKKEVAVVEEVKPVIPLHISTLSRLQQLRDKKLWQQGHIKAYHIELSTIVRGLPGETLCDQDPGKNYGGDFLPV